MTCSARFLLLAVVGLLAPVAIAQAVAANKPLAFEVVSIRPEPAGSSGRDQTEVTPNGWHMRNGTLFNALLTAYVPTTGDAMMYTGSTLTGIPSWMRTERYSIDARVPESELAAWQNPATQRTMLRMMMQAMLADRCKLVVHRSSKDVAVYKLTVAKSGARLQAAVPNEEHAGAFKIPGGGQFLENDGTGKASFFAAPVGALAVVLSNFAGRPVEDETGLTGVYDMTFRRPRIGAPTAEADADPDPPPTVFAVAESFGLRLDSAKRTVEVLTVDHMDKPSEN